MPELDIDVWTWLRQCLDCGKVHTFRVLHNHEGRRPGVRCRCPGTWTDPDDGHAYRRRVLNANIDELQREYEAKQ